MNILNIDGLAVRLRDEQVSEREKLNYIFLLMAMSLLTGAPNILVIMRRPLWLVVYGAILGIGIVGIVACYNINRRGDNRAFVERLVILAAPVSMRVVVMLYAATLVLSQTGVLRRFHYSTNIMITGGIQLVIYGLGLYWLQGAMSVASSGPMRTSAIVKSALTPHHTSPQTP